MVSRRAPVMLSVSQSGSGGGERQLDDETGSGPGLPLQRAAQSFQALAHTAQSIALGSVGAAAVIGNFQRAQVVAPLQADIALPGLGMTDDVGYRLAQRERQHRLLRRAQRQLI